jgi:hypothetical protein
MGRIIACPADQWTVIFNHAFVQLPWARNVTFRATDSGLVIGEVRVDRSSWLFPNPPSILPLEEVMTFRRGYWNTFFKVQVKPTQDLVATIG